MSPFSRRAVIGLSCALLALPGCKRDPSDPADGSGVTTGSAGAGGDGMGGAGGSSDGMPPGAPGNLTIVASDTPFGASLAWTAPSDEDVAGYLVVRAGSAAELAAIAPENGTAYTPVNTFGPGAPVVSVGEATEALDTGVPLERVSHYAVWAVDGGGLYGPPATGQIDVPFPPQRGTIRIDDSTGSPTVTVVSQPSHAVLAASAQYAGPVLEVQLSVANGSHRVWFNPKIIIDQISDPGATATASGTTADGRVASYLGPRALGVGMFRNGRLSFQGVTESTVTVDVSIEGSPAFITPNHSGYRSICILDISGARDQFGRTFGGQVQILGAESPYQGLSGGGLQMREAMLSPDGRVLVMSRTRNAPWFDQIDLTTGITTRGPSLGVDGCLSKAVVSADRAYLYVAHFQGGRCGQFFNGMGTNGPMDFVRVAADTLAEVDRVPLLGAGTSFGAVEIALSPDESRAAVPLRPFNQIALVDVATMQVIDTDGVTPGVQHIALPQRPDSVHFSPDGTRIYATGAREMVVNSLAVIDLSDFGVTMIPSTISPSINAQHGDSVFAPDGRLWIGRSFGGPISIVDITNDSVVDVGTGSVRAMAFHDGAAYAFDYTNNSIRRFDATTLAEHDWDGNAANGVTSLPLADFCVPMHGAFVTPF